MDTLDDVFVKRVDSEWILLLLHVDDSLLLGRPDLVQAVVDEFRAAYDLCAPAELFLGIGMFHREVDGVVFLALSQREHAEALVAACKTAAGKNNLRAVDTPTLRDPPPEADFASEGRMAGLAPRFIEALLWLARCTRPDLSFAVCFLAKYASKWCLAADRYLERICAYVDCTTDMALQSVIHRGDTLRVVALADADHAGCPTTSRSTSGSCTYLVVDRGGTSLVGWHSHRQGCTAVSTAEAELVSLSEALRRDLVPTTGAVNAVYWHEGPVGVLGTDSAAALAAVRKGSSAALRHVRKVHRVALAAVSDVAAQGIAAVVKVDGERNVSDVFTKALPPPRFRELRNQLGGRPLRDALSAPPTQHAAMGLRPDLETV